MVFGWFTSADAEIAKTMSEMKTVVQEVLYQMLVKEKDDC